MIACLGSEASRLVTGRRPAQRSGGIYFIFVLWLFDRLPIPQNPLILQGPIQIQCPKPKKLPYAPWLGLAGVSKSQCPARPLPYPHPDTTASRLSSTGFR